MSVLLFILTFAIGGLISSQVKLALDYFSPFAMVALRFGIATFILLPFVIGKRIPIKQKDFMYLLLSAAMIALNFIFFTSGIGYTSIIMGQLIYLPTSLIVAVIGYFFLKEKLQRAQFLGLGLTFFGFSLLAVNSFKTNDILSFGTPMGNGLLFMAVAASSLYIIFSRKIIKTYSPVTITFFSLLASTVAALLLVPLEIARGSFLINITQKSIFLLGILSIVSSALIYYLYQELIARTNAFITSLIVYPSFVIGAIAGTVLFGESLKQTFLFGATMVFFGVFIATSYNYLERNLKLLRWISR